MQQLVASARPALEACCSSIDIEGIELEWTRLKTSLMKNRFVLCSIVNAFPIAKVSYFENNI